MSPNSRAKSSVEDELAVLGVLGVIKRATKFRSNVWSHLFFCRVRKGGGCSVVH